MVVNVEAFVAVLKGIITRFCSLPMSAMMRMPQAHIESKYEDHTFLFSNPSYLIQSQALI